MADLKFCPFCGGEANVIDHHNDDGSVSVGCNNDTCLGFSGLGWLYKTEAEAIEAWNTRTAATDDEFARAVHDGNLWRRIKDRIRCQHCGLNIESVVPLDGCNRHAIKHCPNCGRRVTA